ncbi:MAG: metallophosphoesterase [Polyangiaceae bacterium]
MNEMRNAAFSKLFLATSVALALFAEGCVGVPEERAQRDETIGQGATAGMTLQIVDGLGVVRQIEPGIVKIRAQAPSLDIRVSQGGGTPTAWSLTVSNVLPNAVLEAKTAAGDTVPVPAPLPSARPTEKQWTLTLPPGDTILSLRPTVNDPTAPWRFAVLGDVQEAIDRVQDIYRRMNADPSITFIACTGDLTQQGTPDQLDRFERELESLEAPFYPTLGNHELGTEDGAVFQRTFGRGSFRFVYRDMQFTFLDSSSATIDPRAYGWLDQWLSEGRNRTHAVLMHIPPLDPTGVRNGAFANRNEAAKLITLLAEGHVDLTLYGHIHTYFAFSNANIPAYISGGGGSIPERFDGIGRHYLTVDVDPTRGVLDTSIVRIDYD